MEKGLAIIEMTDTETRGLHIDQETIECARLNALTKKRTAKAEKARKEAEQKLLMTERAKAKRKAYAMDSTAYVLLRAATLGGSAWACIAGLIDPIIGIPVGLYCLCSGCVRLGAWLERGKK